MTENLATKQVGTFWSWPKWTLGTKSVRFRAHLCLGGEYRSRKSSLMTHHNFHTDEMTLSDFTSTQFGGVLAKTPFHIPFSRSLPFPQSITFICFHNRTLKYQSITRLSSKPTDFYLVSTSTYRVWLSSWMIPPRWDNLTAILPCIRLSLAKQKDSLTATMTMTFFSESGYHDIDSREKIKYDWFL